MTEVRSAERPRLLQQLLVGATIGTAVVIGLGMILIARVAGSCDAFGGRCPAERPSLLEDDVFGMSAFGAALVVTVPMFLSRPSKRRLALALAVGLAAALLIGFAVRAAAYG